MNQIEVFNVFANELHASLPCFCSNPLMGKLGGLSRQTFDNLHSTRMEISK
jgi:hypothetical protein